MAGSAAVAGLLLARGGDLLGAVVVLTLGVVATVEAGQTLGRADVGSPEARRALRMATIILSVMNVSVAALLLLPGDLDLARALVLLAWGAGTCVVFLRYRLLGPGALLGRQAVNKSTGS